MRRRPSVNANAGRGYTPPALLRRRATPRNEMLAPGVELCLPTLLRLARSTRVGRLRAFGRSSGPAGPPDARSALPSLLADPRQRKEQKKAGAALLERRGRQSFSDVNTTFGQSRLAARHGSGRCCRADTGIGAGCAIDGKILHCGPGGGRWITASRSSRRSPRL